MPYNKIFIYFILLILANCSGDFNKDINMSQKIEKKFINSGFALIYNNELANNKIVSKKIEDRSLTIFQSRLKKGSSVKVTNLTNGKVIIAKVGNNASYPLFFNSVISKRIASELELDNNEPYIEIMLIPENYMFIAKKAKTFDEEKKVANKAPVDGIKISDLKKPLINIKKKIKKKFSYNLKIADFYYDYSANNLVQRIENETSVSDVKIKKISDTKFRVFLGPFNDIKKLQESFESINILEFENLEILRND
jgi:hypothetical protein